MDISMLAPTVARLLGVTPATAVLLILAANRIGAMIARAIPNDATGWRAIVRKIAAIIGTEVPSKLTSGVTVADAAKAAITTPPIKQKVEEATGVALADDDLGENVENQRNRPI